MVTCRFCKQKISKAEAFNPSPKQYYCSEEHYRLKQDKDKYKPKRVKTNGEPNERRMLLDYIQELYVEQGYEKHTINWKMITSVLKNQMAENKDMKYTGIQYTLWFCKEVKQMDLFSDKSNSVLWCVPFEYQNACEYWKNCYDLEQSLEEFDFNIPTIVVNKNTERKKSPKWEEIDINDIT